MKRTISVFLIAVMLFALVPAAASAEPLKAAEYTDVTAGKWFYDSVNYVCEKGYMNGVSNDRFNPNGSCTRAMVVTILYRMDGEKDSGPNRFDDVPEGRYYTAAVNWAAKKGIVTGTSENAFSPNADVTREQLAAILYRYSLYINADTSKRTALSSFTDAGKVHGYAAEAISWAVGAGLITGTSPTTLNPRGNATRAQIATILARYDKAVLNPEPVEISCSVTFMLNYPSEASDVFNTVTVRAGDTAAAPENAPEREGYLFTGWYIDPGCAEEYDFTSPVSSDIAIYAGWSFSSSYEAKQEAIDASAERAAQSSAYSGSPNPLMERGKQLNKTYLPSFDIDGTGFVRAGTKIADLKGKTIAFFTSDNIPAWSYSNELGETVDEWAWFKQLKSELGLNIRYTVKQQMSSVNSALAYMNAGKQCDIICANSVTALSALCISRDITGLVNINNEGSSPGICKRVMDQLKWGNTYRSVAPIGTVDVLWYNQTLAQTLTQELAGMTNALVYYDPHTNWENGTWNSGVFKSFLINVPRTNKNGSLLKALVHDRCAAAVNWPSTYGAPLFSVDPQSASPAVINNWDNPNAMEAWKFIRDLCLSLNCGTDNQSYLGLFEGATMMAGSMLPMTYHDTEYSKFIQLNWAPYPKGDREGSREVGRFNGACMMLPEKTSKEDNVDFALKFMELWASRYTESIFDNLGYFEYFNFNYKQKKQYFDFANENVTCELMMNNLVGSGVEETNFFNCFTGDPAYYVTAEAAKASNLIQAYVVESLKYGQ